MTVTDFARLIDVDVTEIEKLLNGEAVDEPTARKFIYFFGADKAQHFIDWVAIGKINPLASENAKGASENDSD